MAYMDTLLWCAGAICLKNMLLHVMVVRARLATKRVVQDQLPESNPDTMFLYNLLCYLTFAIAGPLRTENDLFRLQAMENNAAQNETYFLILASLWPSVAGGAPEWAASIIMMYTLSRFVHLLLFAVLKVQPWRAFAWTFGCVIVIVMSVNILASSKPGIVKASLTGEEL